VGVALDFSFDTGGIEAVLDARSDYWPRREYPGGPVRFIAPEELPGVIDTVLDVREVYLDAALDALRAEFGSVLRYLEAAAGVDATRIDRLRSALLT
jgi:hypothetical protein